MERAGQRLRDIRPARLETPAKVLVVSPSFALRNTCSIALEDDGHVVLEAATADEVLWCLVAGDGGDGTDVDLLLVDASTPGALTIVREVRSATPPPAVVVVGRGLRDARLAGLHLVPAPDRVEDVRLAVAAALAARDRPRRSGGPPGVVVAVQGASRRDALTGALVRHAAGVMQVADGLELLELLGQQILEPDGWYPETLVVDARLPRLDGVDALHEIRQFDRHLRAVVLAAPDDRDARRVLGALLPVEVLDRETPVPVVADRVLRRRRCETTRSTRLRAVPGESGGSCAGD